MDGTDGRATEAQAKASPWPALVAMGIVAAETGVLFGLVPVAVGSVIAFGWGAAGMAREAGYAADRWRPLRLVGGVIGGAAALVWAVRSTAVSARALVAAATTDAIAVRAAVVLAAGVLLIVVGYAVPAVAAATQPSGRG